MPAKPSGKIVTSTVRSRQKNGDIYIFERETQYDPEKKYNKVLRSKLIAKIPKGSDTPVPTRPKQRIGERPEKNKEAAAFPEKQVGMMDIIEHIGKVSGIDYTLCHSMESETAKKIISLARYLFATNGQPFSGILTWQYDHPLPWEEGITEDVYQNLFKQIGRDEYFPQLFFMYRSRMYMEDDVVVYDLPVVSSVFSSEQSPAGLGYNGPGVGQTRDKLLVFYSSEGRQPLAYAKVRGILSDAAIISDVSSVLGIIQAEVVTEEVYDAGDNFSAMLQAEMDFIATADTNQEWVRAEIDKRRDELDRFSNSNPLDTWIHGVSAALTHDTGKRIYLHIYCSNGRYGMERTAFESDLMGIKNAVEEGTPTEQLSAPARDMLRKYFVVRTRGEKTSVIPKNQAIEKAVRYFGFFALVSSKEKDPFECLRKYKDRETAAFFLDTEKRYDAGPKPRGWDDAFRGQLFVRFVALCYYEYLHEKLRKIQDSLGRATGDKAHDRKENFERENALKTWIRSTPLYLQLQWFDTAARTDVSEKLKEKRQAKEIISRDALYLEKLGVTTP